jgi:hypothetical protein
MIDGMALDLPTQDIKRCERLGWRLIGQKRPQDVLGSLAAIERSGRANFQPFAHEAEQFALCRSSGPRRAELRRAHRTVENSVELRRQRVDRRSRFSDRGLDQLGNARLDVSPR